jgi:hypothetical protein
MIESKDGLSTADLAGRSDDADAASDVAAQPETVTEAPAHPAGSPPTEAPPAEAPRAQTGEGTPATTEEPAAPLFDSGDAEGYRGHWTEIQTGFVDDPRKTVEQADTLVAEVMKRLAEVFADERANLEQQWGKGQEADTEGLRMALRRYRSFFDRLLSV